MGSGLRWEKEPQSIENQLQETLQARMTTVQIKQPCPKPRAAAMGTGQTNRTQSYIVSNSPNPHWNHSETSNIIDHTNLLMLQSSDKIKIYKGKKSNIFAFFLGGGVVLETVSLYIVQASSTQRPSYLCVSAKTEVVCHHAARHVF